MHILLVSHVEKNPNAGASLVYHLLEEGLAARGHTVDALHYENFRVPRFATRMANRLLLPHLATRCVKTRNVERYDVIMSSNGMLYPLFKRLKADSRRPLLVNHIHGLNFFDYQAILTEKLRGHIALSLINRLLTGPLPVRWDALGSRFGDITIVQNSRDLDFLADQGVSKAIKIPLSIHPDIMSAAASAPPPESRDPHRLLWFGSWTERKGIHYLPRAFAMICARYPNVRLTIGGTGMSPQLLRRKFNPSLWSRLEILPRVSRRDQAAEFSRNSIFLFPSISEGFGYALLEAMSLGLAVVTTQTGAAGDLLRDGQDSRIIPTASATHLAEATIELIGNRELRCQIARSAQQLSRSLTTSRFIDCYEAAFEKYRHENTR